MTSHDRRYPYLVVRYMAAVYGEFEVVFVDDASAGEGASRAPYALVVVCPRPFRNGVLTPAARQVALTQAQAAARRTGRSLCAVFGERDGLYVEPNGAWRQSADPPSGGVRSIRFPIQPGQLVMRRPVAVRLQDPERWQRDSRWVLASSTRAAGQPVFKFCYEPPTGRLWLGSGSQNHKEILNVKTGRTLDQVVRGIYFRAQRIIYLRYCENEKWLRETAAMLRFHGMPPDHCITWGAVAAKKLRHLLEGL